MKINSITTQNRYHSRGMLHSANERREHATLKDINNENNQINTTIKSNSDGRVNFKGGVPALHKIAKYTMENPLIAEAIFALFITCGLRPLTIMATAKNDTDKSKCEYQAVKSISSGLVGLGMTALVGTPIGKATKAVQKAGAVDLPKEVAANLDGTIKKGANALSELIDELKVNGISFADDFAELLDGQAFDVKKLKQLGKKGLKATKAQIKENVDSAKFKEISDGISAQFRKANYSSTGKNVLDKLFQPAFMPLRAAVTIALVPIILKALGKQKPSKPKEATQAPVEQTAQQPVQQQSIKTNVPMDQKGKEIFGSIDKTANNNPSFSGSQNASTPSFKGGITDFAVKPLTKLYHEVAQSGLFQKGVTKFSGSNRTFTHLMVLDSIILSTFYTINSLRNKKIEKEQKPQMVINDALTLGVSAAGSYLLDDKVSKVVTKFGENYVRGKEDFYKGLGQKAIDEMGDKASIKELLAKVDEVLKLPKDKLDEGLEQIGTMFKEHIKPIVSADENVEKALMTTQSVVDDLADKVTSTIKDAVKEGKTDDVVKAVSEKVQDAYKTVVARSKADNFMSGLNKLKVLVVFGMIYRFIGPVVITPIANKLSDKFFGKDKADKKAKVETASKQPQQQVVQQAVQQSVSKAVKPENLLSKHLQSTTA